MSVLTFDVDNLVAQAREKEGVEPRDTGFLEPLGVLCEAYAAADLSDVGRWVLRAGLVHSLRQRLRLQAWTDEHPEIL